MSVYNFAEDEIDLNQWGLYNPYGILCFKNGLAVNNAFKGEYGIITCPRIFIGDWKFTLFIENFYAKVKIFKKDIPSVSLQILPADNPGDNVLFIKRGHGKDGEIYRSNCKTDDQWQVSCTMPAFSDTCSLSIIRRNEMVSVIYNESPGLKGTRTPLRQYPQIKWTEGKIKVGIEIYSGDDGSFEATCKKLVCSPL